MSERARMIPYDHVVQVYKLGYAWLKLEDEGVDAGPPIFIQPVKIGFRSYDSETNQWMFTFEAKDVHGHHYSVEVTGTGAPLSHDEELMLGVVEETGELTYTVRLNVPLPRVARRVKSERV